MSHTSSRGVAPALLSLAVLILAFTQTAARAQSDAPLPEPGKPIERELAGGAAHSYTVALAANQFLRAVVEQRGIDVVARLFAPDGRQVVEVDSPNGAHGSEVVMFVAEAAGAYRLEVRSPEEGADAGRYELRTEESRAATPRDASRVAARALYVRGWQSLSEGKPEALREAVRIFEQALPLWRDSGDRRGEVDTLDKLAAAHEDLKEQAKAVEIYERALVIAGEIGDRQGEAILLNNIGNLYSADPANKEKSLGYYTQALAILRELGDRRRAAYVLNNIGEVYIALSADEQPKAFEYYLQALPLMREVSDKYGEQHVLFNLGILYAHFNESVKAIEHFTLRLPLLRALGDREEEAATLNYIGSAYATLGDNQRALAFHTEALPLSRAIKSREVEAFTLRNIGRAYLNLGDMQAAHDYFEQAGEIAKSDPSEYAFALYGLGSVYAATGETDKALDHFARALKTWEEERNRRWQGSALTNIGSVYRDLGQHRKALEYFNRALALKRVTAERRGEGYALSNIGNAYHSLGETGKGLDAYAQALALGRAVGDRSLEALTLYGMGRARLSSGDLAGARSDVEAALVVVEMLRSQIIDDELRSSYFGSVRQYYETYIDVLMRMHERSPAAGHDAEALQVSERARARGMLELLAESEADIRQGADPKMLERERSLQQALNAKAERQARVLGEPHTEAQAAALKREINELLTEYQNVRAQIKSYSPRYAALTQPAPLTAAEIQRQALGPDTMLLEYALGDERSYLWAVTDSPVKSFVLPKGAEIEAATRRVYELLTARNRRVKFETPEERRARVARADAEYERAASELSRTLLGPVAGLLGRRRLLVVSDGALHYLPFAALPKPGAAGARPMLLDHEIVSLPSATTLAVLRRELTGRRPAEKTLAVLADPVFEKDDERLKAVRVKTVASVGQAAPVAPRGAGKPFDGGLVRAMRESGLDDGGGRIPRLPFTRQEANEILALAPEAERMKALDFDASRAMATSAELGRYRFVHFATHGLLNSRHPELSGVVLSLVDERGAEQNGFLRVNEIFNLRLPAEMVVLSGCRTGLGKEIKGEGLVGITRSFMYAGAARVLVSVWDVPDHASAELMAQLYREMLGAGKLRPSAALRAAQLKIRKRKDWQAPYFWAAFVLQGEPN